MIAPIPWYSSVAVTIYDAVASQNDPGRAQLLKRLGRPGAAKGLHLPERITPLPREYREADLAKFFKAANDTDKALYSTLTGFRGMEVVHLYWSNFDLQTARVTSKPELGFYPKRREEREVSIPVKLMSY